MAVIPSSSGDASPRDELDAALRTLAIDLREGIPETVERGMAPMRDEVPGCFSTQTDPETEKLILDAYVGLLGFVYDGLEGNGGVLQREAPERAVEDTRVTADRGVDLRAIGHSYRVIHRMLVDEVMEKIRRSAADRHVREGLLTATNRSMFADFDWVTARMAEIYEHERRLLARNDEWSKRRLIRTVLESEDEFVDADQVDYDVSGRHLALVVWGPDAGRVPIAIRRATGVPVLSVSGTPATTWAWLSAAEIEPDDPRLLNALQTVPNARVAFGDRADGIEGFRVSHRQAWGAFRIARETGTQVTKYSDVALLVLTLQDPDAARQFVLSELGPLAGNEPRSQVLRETLSVYFRSGHNGASTAAALGIHDRTVLYRIRTIEDGLGRSVTGRREELSLALRLAPIVLDRPAGPAGLIDARWQELGRRS